MNVALGVKLIRNIIPKISVYNSLSFAFSREIKVKALVH